MKNGTYKVVIENGNESWYDSDGNQIHVKYADGYERWREYDSDGNEIYYKDSNGYEEWREYDSNGKMIHYKTSNGYEWWREFDSNGKMIHYKNSNGFEAWYNSDGNRITKEEFDRIHSSCDGKIVTIEGKQYQLTQV
jgi:hypothetical protein